MAEPKSAQHRVLGRVLREARIERGLSQEALALDSGLHRNYVGACERGEINLSFSVMLKLTAGLQISMSQLMLRYEELGTQDRSVPGHPG